MALWQVKANRATAVHHCRSTIAGLYADESNATQRSGGCESLSIHQAMEVQGTKTLARSHKFLLPIAHEASLCETSQLFEEWLIDSRKVETGLALHPLSQLCRDPIKQLGSDVYGHQVVADIPFPDLDGSEKQRLLVLHDVTRIQAIVCRGVHGQFELRGIRSEDLAKPIEDLI
jgi:hypothetical protein